MESPISPMVWKVLFNVSLGVLSVATLASVYRQKHAMLCTMDDTFAKLRRADTPAAQETLLRDVLARMQSDAIKRQSASRMSALRHGQTLVRLLRLNKDDASNTAVVSAALKVVVRVYSGDAEGRRRLHRCGGYKALLTTLSDAHRHGLLELMEEVAEALHSLTRVNDEEVVLERDVPRGAEGVYALATMPATAKMLRIIDPASPVLLVNALTGIFANVCALHAGAVNIGRGTDGHSGVSFFLRLLDHVNRGVVANSLMVVRYMARCDVGLDEIAAEANAHRIAAQLRVTGEPQVVNTVLTIVLIMLNSSAHGKTFLLNLVNTNAYNALFELWVRSPERVLRGRAEALCRLLMRVGPVVDHVVALFLRYRGQIEERRKKDEQEEQRYSQQMMQNEFMQRMMMQQMGMG